jgi:nucleoside-diphosphate-sugar epimerase
MDVLPPTVGTFNFISSWFSYGDFTTMYESPEADEDAVCRPKGFYSITKKCAEDLLISYSRTFDKSYRILRLCNVMGGDPKAGKQKNAFEFIISKIAAGEDVNIYRGDNFRNVMHVDDVCRAINLIVERGNMNEIYNVGNTSSVKLIDLVDYAISRTGSKSKINYVDAPRFHQIVQSGNFFMNCKKLQSLGFKPKYTITGIVDSVLDRLVIS